MPHSYVTRATLIDFINQLDAVFARPGRLYLIGETTQTFEGWRQWTTQIEFTADVNDSHRQAFSRAVRELQEKVSFDVIDESPADLIPLPEDYLSRARPAIVPTSDSGPKHLELYHFDPYSASFRYIARGDEPDYHIVLGYLDKGWITLDEMQNKLTALLPCFSTKTIQQDPAEFRRKYKGLLQMAAASGPWTTHRATKT